MLSELNPGLILILGAVLVPLLRGPVRKIYMLLLPVFGVMHLLNTPHGTYGDYEMMGMVLETYRLDQLSFVFGLIFHIAAFLGILYALHLKDTASDTMQHVAALIYAGAGVGAVFAGDLMTLFIFWELTAIASVFLIWARGTDIAYKTGIRYLIVQVGSGVLLLAGLVMHKAETGSIAFDHFGVTTMADFTAGTFLIFFAFGIKCAFPFLHNWLQDAYPQATPTGTVILSAFTTKLAVYSLARGYAGLDILIPIGATMTAFPVFFAVIENDLRRVLAYSLNNQLGFMVVGVGVGSALALNGTAAHAFSHILYKALLFMGMGAVLHRVGTTKATELGGLYKSMPWTTVFTIIGAMSISAFPFFSGFISKSLILAALAQEHMWLAWTVLLFASAGVLEHSGIKIPYFSFFAHDSGKRPKEAPWNMLAAMGIAAALCIGIGVWPEYLYAILPHAMDYEPYTPGHIITQMQLLMFAVLAFVVLVRTGLYPPEIPSVNLDTDWLYRRLAPSMLKEMGKAVTHLSSGIWGLIREGVDNIRALAARHHGPSGTMGRSIAVGNMVLWVMIGLAVILLLYL
ncbi:MAG: Na(+)/H(+) antiporter subunit D [Alphaproteobacteria bacterium]